MSFYQVVNPVSFFAVFVVDHGIAEIINVPRCLPGGWVHKYGGVHTYYVFMQLGHALPPVVADIFLEFTSPGAIVVYGAQTIINFAALKNKSIFFGVCNDRLEFISIVR